MITTRLIWQSIVRPYYRQNAGLFVFLFFIMFLAVGRANYVGVVEYHYSLIRGLLTAPLFFVFVLFAWLLYALKCVQFVGHTLSRREYAFLFLLSQLGNRKVYWLFLQVQVLLFLPVLVYVLIILAVGYRRHWYWPTTGVLLFNIAVCLVAAYRYRRLLHHPGSARPAIRRRLPFALGRSYSSFLIGYVLTRRRILFLATKVYSCGILYFTIVNQPPGESDTRMGLLFYSTALLGHAVLLHLVKEMEAARLAFYRGLPVSLWGRLAQYAGFCLFLCLPEMILIGTGIPNHLSYPTAFFLFFFGYSVLLLLNSLRFIPLGKIALLKVLTGIFFLIFLGVLSGTLLWLAVLFLVLSPWIFIARYYR
jgi:hypothetical protein